MCSLFTNSQLSVFVKTCVSIVSHDFARDFTDILVKSRTLLSRDAFYLIKYHEYLVEISDILNILTYTIILGQNPDSPTRVREHWSGYLDTAYFRRYQNSTILYIFRWKCLRRLT